MSSLVPVPTPSTSTPQLQPVPQLIVEEEPESDYEEESFEERTEVKRPASEKTKTVNIDPVHYFEWKERNMTIFCIKLPANTIFEYTVNKDRVTFKFEQK